MKSFGKIGLLLLCTVMIMVSCSGDDGEQGPQGPQGPAGVDGINGVDGQDGMDGQDGANGADGQDGVDGQDGIDGQDGVDGNANVQSFSIDISLIGGSTYTIDWPASINPDPKANSFLFYLKTGTGYYYVAPGALPFLQAGYSSVGFNTNQIFIRFYDNDTSYNFQAGYWVELIIIVTEVNTVGKQNPLAQLESAGIDTSDYHAVAAYFGLE